MMDAYETIRAIADNPDAKPVTARRIIEARLGRPLDLTRPDERAALRNLARQKVRASIRQDQRQ